MVDTSKPFWEQEYSPLDIALDPFLTVESSILLTPQEQANLKLNLTPKELNPALDKSQFFTIYSPAEIPLEHLKNADSELIPMVTNIENDYGYDLIKNSVYRSMSHHLRIYAQKGITDQSKIPMKSWHLFFLAADLKPRKMPIEHFHKWLIANNEDKLKKHNAFMEHESHTRSWAHLQTRPYASFKLGMSRRYHIK